MNIVGLGIFGWWPEERHVHRYGSFFLSDKTSDEAVSTQSHLEDLSSLVGKRVKIQCRVIEARESVHIGDRYLDIYPTTPVAGEVIELGVATLGLETEYSETSIIMEPGDERSYFWIDPHKLYRLHNQTVEISIEETDEPFTTAPEGWDDPRLEASVLNVELIGPWPGGKQSIIVAISQPEE